MVSHVVGLILRSPCEAGSLHESFAHECLKSPLAFRKPAMAAASRRPARADAPKVGLDISRWPCMLQASAPGELRVARWAGSATSAPAAGGGKAMFVARRLT